MKQNMCVTIDEEIHRWLKSRGGMISRTVNGILWAAMKKEMTERAINAGDQKVLPIEVPVARYCSKCDTTQTGINNWCINKSCPDQGRELEEIK